jgi:hypothetical protein
MSGAYDIECGTWKHATTGTGILTLVDGTTLIVNSGLQVSGSAVSIPTQLTAATGATLDYDGTSANAKVGFNVFNNITATHPIDVWYGGTHTGSTGFTNRTSADIGSSGGIMINPGLSGGLR